MHKGELGLGIDVMVQEEENGRWSQRVQTTTLVGGISVASMSDYDEYFDSIDEEALAQLRELEESHEAPGPSKAPARASMSKRPAASEDDSELFEFSLDNAELAQLEEAAIKQHNSPAKASSTTAFSRVTSNPRQLNLRGEYVEEQPAQRQPQSRPAFGQRLNKTKVWDSTAFAKTGWKSTKPPKNAKGKGKATMEQDMDEEEYVDLDGLATPFMPRKLDPLSNVTMLTNISFTRHSCGLAVK